MRQSRRGPNELAHGGARGLDEIAAEVAAELGLYVLPPWLPSWATHGRAAGHERNAEMIRESRALALLAWPDPGSRGTWQCAGEAVRERLPVVVTLAHSDASTVPGATAVAHAGQERMEQSWSSCYAAVMEDDLTKRFLAARSDETRNIVVGAELRRHVEATGFEQFARWSADCGAYMAVQWSDVLADNLRTLMALQRALNAYGEIDGPIWIQIPGDNPDEPAFVLSRDKPADLLRKAQYVTEAVKTWLAGQPAKS